MKRPQYKVQPNVTLKNRFNSDTVQCDIINEDSIDGKLYYVVRQNGRVVKYSKESFSVMRGR